MILPYILAFLLLWPAMPAVAQVGESYSAARLDRWRILGPGGGGAQFYVAASPHDPNLVLVACDMTGAYISKDGGNSWRMFNLGSPVKFFAFDPNRTPIGAVHKGIPDNLRRGNRSIVLPAAITSVVPGAAMNDGG